MGGRRCGGDSGTVVRGCDGDGNEASTARQRAHGHGEGMGVVQAGVRTRARWGAGEEAKESGAVRATAPLMSVSRM